MPESKPGSYDGRPGPYESEGQYWLEELLSELRDIDVGDEPVTREDLGNFTEERYGNQRAGLTIFTKLVETMKVAYFKEVLGIPLKVDPSGDEVQIERQSLKDSLLWLGKNNLHDFMGVSVKGKVYLADYLICTAQRSEEQS